MKDYIGKVIEGNSLEVLKNFEDNSIDSIITDPPYEISFMQAKWDRTGIAFSIELWKECLRVLKPGGHILSFGATKTYHRMACAIEDAGFETRNCINWIYMQGFSKGVNISKAFDKKAKAEREVIGIKKGGGMSVEKGNIFRDDNWTPKSSDLPITIPATDLAKQWDDWHSDLKPSHELIYVGRKPLSEKTIVDNVEKWGTGALNIGGSRVETTEVISNHSRSSQSAISKGKYGSSKQQETHQTSGQQSGRFPSNTIIDGSPEVLEQMRSYGERTSGSMKPHHKVGNKKGDGTLSNKILGTYNAKPYKVETEQSTGTIDRFFKKCEFADIDVPAFLYYPKPSQAERNLGCEGLTKEVGEKIITGNYHNTVKPVALMRYLIKLITPKHGTVLDPFCGSGTTLVAAEELKEFYWIGIDNDPDAVLISNSRLKPFLNLNSLFDERQK